MPLACSGGLETVHFGLVEQPVWANRRFDLFGLNLPRVGELTEAGGGQSDFFCGGSGSVAFGFHAFILHPR